MYELIPDQLAHEEIMSKQENPVELSSTIMENSSFSRDSKIFGFKVIVRDTWTSLSGIVIDSLEVETASTLSVITTITFSTTMFEEIQVNAVAAIPANVPECF